MIRSFENFVVRCRVYDFFNHSIGPNLLPLLHWPPRMINGAACCSDFEPPGPRRDVASLSQVHSASSFFERQQTCDQGSHKLLIRISLCPGGCVVVIHGSVLLPGQLRPACTLGEPLGNWDDNGPAALLFGEHLQGKSLRATLGLLRAFTDMLALDETSLSARAQSALGAGTAGVHLV